LSFAKVRGRMISLRVELTIDYLTLQNQSISSHTQWSMHSAWTFYDGHAFLYRALDALSLYHTEMMSQETVTETRFLGDIKYTWNTQKPPTLTHSLDVSFFSYYLFIETKYDLLCFWCSNDILIYVFLVFRALQESYEALYLKTVILFVATIKIIILRWCFYEFVYLLCEKKFYQIY